MANGGGHMPFVEQQRMIALSFIMKPGVCLQEKFRKYISEIDSGAIIL